MKSDRGFPLQKLPIVLETGRCWVLNLNTGLSDIQKKSIAHQGLAM